MPFPVEIVGRSTAPVVHEVDDGWLRAFAAAVGDRSGSKLGHPLFPVCVEWPAVTAAARLDDGALLADERRRGIHTTHDLTIHRRVRSGDVVTTVATVERIEPRPRGTVETLRLETRDDAGALIATTLMGSMFLGVTIAGDPPTATARTREQDDRRAVAPPATEAKTIPIDVAADQARTYSQAARIWNPIHTEPEAARRAGLPEAVLHGTCTLGLAITAALAATNEAAPTELVRVRARFSGMVTMPSRLELRVWQQSTRVVRFEVADAHHTVVVRDGRLDFGTGPLSP